MLDALDKRSPVTVLYAEPITPGRYWIAFAGGEAEIEEALDAAITVSDASRIDHTYLAYAHEAVMRALCEGLVRSRPEGSVGVLELETLAATIRAADAALKCAAVSLVDMHLARGIGGKGYVVLTGALSDVEAAVEAGAEAAGEGRLVGREVIANPERAVVEASARGVRGSAR